MVRSGEAGGEERRRVFDAVGFSFVNRLLVTRESPCYFFLIQISRCNVMLGKSNMHANVRAFLKEKCANTVYTVYSKVLLSTTSPLCS